MGDILGGADKKIQDEISNALFSPSRLNLNILRYTIGGTTPEDLSCGDFHPGAATESFRDGPHKLYLWDRDSRTRNILLAAKSLGVDTFEAVSLSPPSWLTRTGCTKGNSAGAPLHDNLDPINAPAFADYLSEVIRQYSALYDIDFSTVIPFRAPSSGNWSGSDSVVEGCNMERSTMVEVIKSLDLSLGSKNLHCKISAAGELTLYEELETQQYLYREGVGGLYSKVNLNLHSGSSDQKTITQLYSHAANNKYDIWMTDAGFVKSTFPDMTQGLELAERIIFDLRNIVPSAWIYHQAIEDQVPGYYRGLLDIPLRYLELENVEINSGYYTMMHFSKYIRKDYSLIHINDADSVAAFGRSTLVIVTVNSGSSTTSKTFDLSRFNIYGQAGAVRTSSTEPHIPISPPVINNNQITFEFPSRSVTTIQFSNVDFPSRDNLLDDGDFESPVVSSWELMDGSRADNGINGNFVRRGEKSGFLDFSESKLSLVQSIIFNDRTPRNLHLSAWCVADGPGVKLGLQINGQQGPEVSIAPVKGYQLYGLSAAVEDRETVTVYLRSDQGNHTAQIDDVFLH